MVVPIVAGGIVALAGFVFAADLGSGLVDSAAAVRLEVSARGADLNVPIAVLDKHGDPLMHEVPTNIIEIPRRLRLIERQGQILAAHGRTMVAGNRNHGSF